MHFKNYFNVLEKVLENSSIFKLCLSTSTFVFSTYTQVQVHKKDLQVPNTEIQVLFDPTLAIPDVNVVYEEIPMAQFLKNCSR